MKSKIFLMSFSAILLLGSCQKENDQIVENEQVINQSELDRTINSLNDENSLFRGIRNPDDEADDRVNKGLYTTAAALLDLSGQEKFLKILGDDANYDRDGEVLISDFFEKGLDINDFNASMKKVDNTLEYGIDNYNAALNYLSHPSGNYVPGIYCINKASGLSNGEFYIAVGAQISAEDKIAAWKISNEKIEEVAIDVDNKQTEAPIFIIVNSLPKDFSYNNETDLRTESVDNMDNDDRASTYFIVDEHRINYRYENIGNSDYYAAVRISPSPGLFYTNSAGYKIRSVHKNDIGKTFYNDYNYNLAGFSAHSVLMVSYERDAFSSKKAVFVPSWTSFPLNVRMKYGHEYYQRMHINMTPPTPVTSNEKGRFKVKF